MKIVFIVCNEVYSHRVMDLLAKNKIDYYTRWEEVAGKGHGTEPHLGTRSFPGLNTVLMIAIEDETILGCLTTNIREANSEIVRPGDRIRMFQVPLDSIL